MIRDIHPKSPIERLSRDFSNEEMATPIATTTVAAVVGMSYNFVVRAAGFSSGSRPKSLPLARVIELLDLDGYQETFVPRSQVPGYLLRQAEAGGLGDQPALRLPTKVNSAGIHLGHARDLLSRLPRASIQCLVTSPPYWGMRVYDNVRDVDWADGEKCPFGFEQTPEGFIRHSVELLHVLQPAMKTQGSVWWNLMDTYNTRTPIRGSSRDKLKAMAGDPEHARGWTDHGACRHSAGHMYIGDGELALIPSRIAERASRIGFYLKSVITWNKDSTPEPVKSRVTRQAEQILHLAVQETPYFEKAAWSSFDVRLGGPNLPHESSKKLTDVWTLPPSPGGNGHGAEFPLSLPARCIALTTKKGDLVLDPFVGSGTSALAAKELGRRFIGFDISDRYVELATTRLAAMGPISKTRVGRAHEKPPADDKAPRKRSKEKRSPTSPLIDGNAATD